MTPAYPYPGCLVEFLEDNSPRIAMVLEDAGGKLRLLLPGRRETKLSANRVLPWLGPVFSPLPGKEEAARILDAHQKKREELAAQAPTLELWEMAQGEIAQAPAQWFAELMETDPDADTVAAYGRALLGCKSRFRFQPPEFTVYDADTVAKRLEEQKAREAREAITQTGNAFLRLLWDVACKKRQLDKTALPEPGLAERIRKILLERMVNPDSTEDEALWRSLSKGLPDEPHVPLRLLIAWGMLPKHYNFWLDRADYEAGDSWWQPEAALVSELAAQGRNPASPEICDLPFVSIDGPHTIDIDDAFFLEKKEDGWRVVIALAAPGLVWPFGSQLDHMISRRATSIYLPEGDLHMLPLALGTDAFSLQAQKPRPVFCLDIELDANSACTAVRPFLATATLAANLRYADVQAVISGNAEEANPALAHAELLGAAHELAGKRENLRIGNGAVIMVRQEPEVIVTETAGEAQVEILPETQAPDATRLVSELMILASSALADWAYERNIPLLHRSQNVTLPPDYAGKWDQPEVIAKIMKSLVPSSLEVQAKPHAALGLERYAQVTSPLRRYPDLVNEAQIAHYLRLGAPQWDARGLEQLLDAISPGLEAAGQVQRYRPRYWKLLWFKNLGDQIWHEGIITDENDLWVTVVLPVQNFQLRGRRNLFGERSSPGAAVKLRIGKVNPLLNEIQILETMPDA
ncbi:MAG: RNB domain-containing ribonuclease [Desulfovibrio sp.]|nr:RNB domain-containing ribonuclease [Desulfovibrio sp.]